MDERTIAIFFAVYESQSIVGATKMVFYSSQNISKTIKKMEEDLAVKLFKRVKNGMLPTEEGQKMYKELKELQHALIEITSYYTETAKNKKVQIYSSWMLLSENLLVKAVEKYEDDMTYVLHNTNCEEVYSALLEARADLGVLVCEQQDAAEIVENLEARGLGVTCLTVNQMGAIYVREDHQLADKTSIKPRDLQQFKRVSFMSEEQNLTTYPELIAQYKLNKSGYITINTVGCLITLLKNQDYYYMGPYIEGYEAYLKGIKRIPFQGAQMMLQMVVAYKKSTPDNPVSVCYLDLLQSTLKDACSV